MDIQSNTTKEFKVERDILFYALRYAIGRKTFAPIITIENIKKNIHLLSIYDLQIIIREIIWQETCGFGYGDECDKKTWMDFLDYLQKTIKSR